MASNTTSKSSFTDGNGLYRAFIAGGIAACGAVTATHPFETVKIRYSLPYLTDRAVREYEEHIANYPGRTTACSFRANSKRKVPQPFTTVARYTVLASSSAMKASAASTAVSAAPTSTKSC